MINWVYSGDRPSNGAKALAQQPGFKRLRTGKGIKPGDRIINWGVTKLQIQWPVVVDTINMPAQVAAATNKLTAFYKLQAAKVQTVPWTEDHTVVDEWSEKGYTIIGRTKLTGHSGDGIIIIEKGEPIQPALLYTKYIFKEKEFRVHVVNGKVIDTQQKIKDPDKEVLSWRVRSHENGFIFARNGVIPSDGRDSLAVATCAALDLDFGAVDIIEKDGEFYVLEVNTAPGLEGQTIASYTTAFQELANVG